MFLSLWDRELDARHVQPIDPRELDWQPYGEGFSDEENSSYAALTPEEDVVVVQRFSYTDNGAVANMSICLDWIHWANSADLECWHVFDRVFGGREVWQKFLEDLSEEETNLCYVV